MKTGICRAASHVLVSSVTLIVLGATTAVAQQQFELPQQSSQGAASSYQPPAPTPIPQLPRGSGVRTLPQLSPQRAVPPAPSYQPTQPPPTAEPPATAYQSQPVLPPIFRGCWQGAVSELDSINRLPGGAKLGTWTPKTYRLCYRRIGNGPFVLTFTEAGVEEDDRITNATGRMTLLSSDGRSYASMRSNLHFDEYRRHVSYFGGNTFAVDEVTNLFCRIESDGMHVTGYVTGWHDGAPWFRARWHAVFVRVGEPAEEAGSSGGIPE